MSWFTVTRGRLEYRGRLTRPPFAQWCATKDGRAAIDSVARGIRFSIVGRARSARRRLWRDLDAVSRTDAFTAAMRAESAHFMQAMADVCYADALPRAQIALRRLVLAPRALVAGRARSAVRARLMDAPVLAGIDAGVRAFLIDQLVIELDAAVRHVRPVPRRPVFACEGWACVGVQLGTTWLDPLWAGPDGTGHFFMFEMPTQGLKRRDAKALDAAIEQIAGTVSSLPRAARDEMMRAASLRRA